MSNWLTIIKAEARRNTFGKTENIGLHKAKKMKESLYLIDYDLFAYLIGELALRSFRFRKVDLTFKERKVWQENTRKACKMRSCAVLLDSGQVGHSGVVSLSSWVPGEGATDSNLISILDMLKQQEVSDRGDIATT